MQSYRISLNTKSFERNGAIARLDCPSASIYTFGPEFRLSGWLVSSKVVSLHAVFGNGDRKSLPVDVPRVDVHERVLGSDPGKTNLVGFDVALPAAPLKLVLTIDGEEFPWANFGVEEIRNARVAEAWELFSLNRLHSVPADVALAAARSPSDDLIFDLLKDAEHLTLSAAQQSHLSATPEAAFRQFSEVLSDDVAFSSFVKSATESGMIRVPSPFGARRASCSDSLQIPNNITALRFVDEFSGEVFYVLQHVTSVDVIYFPGRKLFVHFHYLDHGTAKGCAVAIARDLGNGVKRANRAVDAKFLGVSSAPNGPYHFLYNITPALYHLGEQGLLEQVRMIVDCPGGDFLDTARIFGYPEKGALLDHRGMNARCDEEQGFFIHVGMRPSAHATRAISGFDAYLMRSLPRMGSVEIPHDHFVLWAGIQGQKRRWIEQIDGIVAAADYIASQVGKVTVLVDGWTAPRTKSPRDLREEDADSVVADELMSRLRHHSIKLVGLSPAEKISYAERTDFFIANYATGSIYVARFCKKPGIAHLNTRMPKSDHIHHHTTAVPDELVTDVPDPTNSRLDFVSYSITPEAIVSLLSEHEAIRSRLQ